MPDSSIELADLLRAVGLGERQAFREVYRRTSSKLLGVVLRIVGDRERAEDVLQEAYLRVWRSAGSYSPTLGRPMTWLITIARNRAIDARRERPLPLLVREEDGHDPLDAVADPRDEESAFETADRLRLCLGRLDEEQRRCFLDAYHHGFSREELATRYGRPVNTIKTWLHRSSGTLRTCLEET